MTIATLAAAGVLVLIALAAGPFDPKHAIGISLWDNRQSAEAYQTAMYPQVLAKVGGVIDGIPGRDVRDGFQLRSRHDLTHRAPGVPTMVRPLSGPLF